MNNSKFEGNERRAVIQRDVRFVSYARIEGFE